jgi:hypothetical protein
VPNSDNVRRSKIAGYSITSSAVASSAAGNRSPAHREGGAAHQTSLRLWSRMAQLALGTKYVTVEACNPPASARGNIEITDSGLDVRRDSVPFCPRKRTSVSLFPPLPMIARNTMPMKICDMPSALPVPSATPDDPVEFVVPMGRE